MVFLIKNLKELSKTLTDIFVTEFKWSNEDITLGLGGAEKFLTDLRDDLIFGIEYPYVDKLYRNSYYNYYSSKLKDYSRSTIRLSFFLKDITIDDFYNAGERENLQNKFFGFLILRPTSRKIIGRNILRPDIFKKNHVYFTTSAIGNASINGCKLQIEGFPHCSQDSEMMVCAETTIWSILEYFSHKYPDYKQILPNEINKILSNTSMERQLPSGGLTGLQISFALKEFGFGVKLYSVSQKSYNEESIIQIIRIYTESGIPVVTTIGNEIIGHALNIIGRTSLNKSPFSSPVKQLANGSLLYDFYERQADYMVVDDNLQPYSTIPLTIPAINYKEFKEWTNCKIDGAIVPLHNKIYMEADKARELGFSWLVELSSTVDLPSLVVRTLLTSSRSYKDYAIKMTVFNNVIKNAILTIDMPKFIWLIELSNLEIVDEEKACGMILIDATEPKKFNVLATFIQSLYIKPENGELTVFPLPLPSFNNFHNLKQF